MVTILCDVVCLKKGVVVNLYWDVSWKRCGLTKKGLVLQCVLEKVELKRGVVRISNVCMLEKV